VTLSHVTTYRIDELADAAASALVAVGAVPPSARVSALPDRRMLRYYTTLGLLDRPLEIRGRTAYYGRRHLLQIVAVKRLQAAGATLADVQARLSGATTGDLERIADLPATNDAVPSPAPARREFWRAPPAPAAVPTPVAVRLGPSVTLVVDAARQLTDAEHDALRSAAGPLLDHLTARGLIAAESQER
jgi:DNA-binding transcriptional MerR regulator